MTLQPTILIVDDEKHARDGLRRLLENDYDVYVAPVLTRISRFYTRESLGHCHCHVILPLLF
jgi:CheY-like chemotaxis protein